MAYLNFNGVIHGLDTAIFPASNRAFRYGDGLFESIRVFEGAMPFFHLHCKRLLLGLDLLVFEIPAYFTPDFLEAEIRKLIGNKGNWRVRLTVFRKGNGLYAPDSSQPEFLIEAAPLDGPQYQLNKVGLGVGFFDQPLLQSLETDEPTICSIKTINALPFVLGGIYKQKKGWDDCLLLNNKGRVACGGSSNVFLLREGTLVTPPLSEGCVSGILRTVLKQIAHDMGYQILEIPISRSDFLEAEEVLLTNAVQGIRWVRLIEGIERKYDHALAHLFHQQLQGFTVLPSAKR